jgi:hypothetical protein
MGRLVGDLVLYCWIRGLRVRELDLDMGQVEESEDCFGLDLSE